MALHPMLSRFVEKMQENLDAAREVKGESGWRGDGAMLLEDVLHCVETHADQAAFWLKRRQKLIEERTPPDDAHVQEKVQHELADAANYLAMVFDRVGFNEW